MATVVATLLLAVATAAAAEEEEATESAHQLHLKLVGAAAFTDGDTAQFQQRHRIPDNISGGIDRLYYASEIAEDTELEVEGRAIFDNRDYLLSVSIDNDKKGFLHVGYRQFRTWYDGGGGYFPPANAYFRVFDPKLGLDRGEAWARGGLHLPQGFELTVGYRYLFRDGTKSSVEWGDSSALGLAAPNNRRNIVPSFYSIDEDRHQVDAELTRETENTLVGAGFRYETTSLDDRKNVTRQPGEPAERRFTQRENSDSDMFGVRTFGKHHMLGDKVTVSGAYAYNDIDLDLGSSRIYGAGFNAAFDPTFAARQQRDEGFFDLAGSTEMREHVGNLAVASRPHEDVYLLSALRVRGEQIRGHADFIETNVGGAPDFHTELEELQTASDTDELSIAEEMEARYTGVDDLVLYVRGAWEQNEGDIYEIETLPVTAAIALERRSDINRLSQSYAVGAKYYPLRWMHLSSEYSYRLRDYDYDHRLDSTLNDPVGPPPSGDRYPAFLVGQEFATHDLSFRATFRLPGDLSLVGRYDWLNTTIDTRGELLAEIQSAEVRSHILGATVTWNPVHYWWIRSGFNYVRSETDTAVNNYDTTVAPFSPTFENDYVTANFGTGVALDALTDAELRYHYLFTDNYRDLSLFTQPYAAESNEHGVMARVGRRLSDHARISVGYGYFINDEAYAGGNYDYDVHLLTSSVELDY